MKELGNSIKFARLEIKFTQKQVLDKINCEQSVISKIESGQLVGAILIKYLKYLRKKGVNMHEMC